MDWSSWFRSDRRSELVSRITQLPAETRAKLPEGLVPALGELGNLVSPDAASNRSRFSEVKALTPSKRAEEIPENQRKAWVDELSASVRAASDARSQLVKLLSAETLVKTQKDWSDRGWTLAAARVGSAVTIAQRLAAASTSDKDLPGPIDIADALAAAADALRVQDALAKAEIVQKKLVDSGDEILKHFPQVINREGSRVLAGVPEKDAATRLVESIAAVERSGDEAFKLLTAADRDLVSFQATPTHDELKKSAADLNAAGLNRWLATFRGEEFLVLSAGELATIEQRRTTLATKVKGMLADLERAVEKKRKFPADPPEKTRAALNAITADLSKVGLDAADKPIRLSKASRPPIDAAYAAIEARTATFDNKTYIPRGLANSQALPARCLPPVLPVAPAPSRKWPVPRVPSVNNHSSRPTSQPAAPLSWARRRPHHPSPEKVRRGPEGHADRRRFAPAKVAIGLACTAPSGLRCGCPCGRR
jgi:hypothetical protein